MEWMLMPLRRYAEFSGRSRRQEFWMWQLFKFLVGIVFMVVFGVIFGVSAAAMMSGGGNPGAGSAAALGIGIVIFYLIMLVLGLGVLVPDLAVTVRRLHDTGRTGKWLFAGIGPYILGAVLAGIGAGAQSSALALLGFVFVLAGFAGFVAILVFMFLDGTPGPNQYGPDPKLRGGPVGMAPPPAY